MTYNEAETRFYLIDPVLREKGYDDHQWLKLETPAHFGFTKTGDLLDEDQLPFGLTARWREDEETKGKPYPTFARMLPKRGTKGSESRYSWTVDFTARRAKARKEMKPHLAEMEKVKLRIIE